MGLDAYFYIDYSVQRRSELKAAIDNIDVSKTLKSIESLLTADNEMLKRLAYAIDRFLEFFKDKSILRLHQAIAEKLHEYDSGIPLTPEDIGRKDAGYFRKFWFLNDFFDYGDEWYAKDKPVTRKQIETLKELCNEAKKKICDIPEFYEEERNKIVSGVFSYDVDSECVEYLGKICEELLLDVDWDTDRVYYNANW